MSLRTVTRVALGSLRQGVPARGYYNPTVAAQAAPINDGATDGGISTPKDMMPETQARRFNRDFLRDLHAKRKANSMSKEEFIKFTAEYEASKHPSLSKVPTTIEELPQSDQDWLAGKNPAHPLKHHPFVMKRAKAMLAGSWVPAVMRHDGHVDDFKQPLNDPKQWIDFLDNTQFEYFDDAASYLPKIGASRCAVTLDTLKATLRAMLRAKQQSPDRVGHLAHAMADLMYDYQFCFSAKLDAETYNLLLAGCAKMGEWRFGYQVEDAMIGYKFTPDPALLKKLDEVAQFAWEKGYMLPPRMQGKDLADFFKVDTRGGVGAYVPLPRGESWGYELFEFYEKQKKEGTFVPALNTPAWEEYAKGKPELQLLKPEAALKAFQDDFSHFMKKGATGNL